MLIIEYTPGPWGQPLAKSLLLDALKFYKILKSLTYLEYVKNREKPSTAKEQICVLKPIICKDDGYHYQNKHKPLNAFYKDKVKSY